MLLNLQESIRGICRCYLQHFLQHETLLLCIVNSDGATSNLIAIQHKVVVLATDLQRDRDTAAPKNILHRRGKHTGNEAMELC